MRIFKKLKENALYIILPLLTALMIFAAVLFFGLIIRFTSPHWGGLIPEIVKGIKQIVPFVFLIPMGFFFIFTLYGAPVLFLKAIKDFRGGKKVEGKAYFHFHPSVTIEKNEDGFIINNHIQLIFNHLVKVTELETLYSPEFNIYKRNVTLEVIFEKECTTTIKIQ